MWKHVDGGLPGIEARVRYELRHRAGKRNDDVAARWSDGSAAAFALTRRDRKTAAVKFVRGAVGWLFRGGSWFAMKTGCPSSVAHRSDPSLRRVSPVSLVRRGGSARRGTR